MVCCSIVQYGVMPLLLYFLKDMIFIFFFFFFQAEDGIRDLYVTGVQTCALPILRVASRGGNADYYGISWEKIERNNGIFWPCPTEEHPGTPRLFEERFYHPDGKAKFHAIEYNPPKEVPDEEFPLILTSGRVVYQYLSGNQTRRIGFLVEQCPEPYVEVHPETALQLNVSDGERVR